MYRTYNARPIPKPYRPEKVRRGRRVLLILLLVIVLAGGYATAALLRPVPALETTVLPPVVPAQVRVTLPWPAEGQAAIGADGYGLLASNNEQKPAPTASIAKLIAAMAILEKKPMQAGSHGPQIPITAADVSIYEQYVARDGAVVPVTAGTSISQYQALQAMLLPSSNNIADTTAIWAFGSLQNYTDYANQMVKRLGMTQTTVGSDASGFSPSTLSTASDLIRLGDAALDHPALSEIVGQREATFPGFGTIQNVNNQLGVSGIRGIKTGNTDEAGGCYLAAADILAEGKKITVITVIMGSSSRPQAMRDSIPLITAAPKQFRTVRLVEAGQSVGTVAAPWGSTSQVVADKDMSVVAWVGSALSPRASAASLEAPAAAGSGAGRLFLSYAGQDYATDLTTKTTVDPPTLWWRLRNLF